MKADNQFSRLYMWALNRGIIIRWTLFIVPFLALLWIPGILGVTAEKDAHVWGVKLVSFHRHLFNANSSSFGQSGSQSSG